MGMNLFDDAGDDIEAISKIETNKEFARRYEHNKKREDLDRLKELKKKGLVRDSDEESSESEESDVEASTIGKNDIKFLNALLTVKNRDPKLTQKDAKLFDSEEEDSDEEEEEAEKRKSKMEKKPMYLKDVVAKNLIEGGADLDEEGAKSGVKTYSEEQDELRKALIDATEGAFDDEDGDLLRLKDRDDGEEEGEDVIEKKKKLDEYFGEDEKLEENEKFLKGFFVNNLWIDKDKGKKPYNGDTYVLSDDEEAVEKQEKYEAEYNFRFEEGAGDRVLGHARVTEGSVRKKNNARKLQRQSKEERMAQAEFQRKEELKHLKNLKRKEIAEKFEKIRAIAGIAEDGTFAINEDDLEEDFDPEEYDRKMKETFDMDYYEKEDVDPGFGSDGDEDGDDLEKPDFEKEDELLGLPKDWDVCGSGDGFSAIREKILKSKAKTKDIDVSDDSEEAEEEEPEGEQRESKRKRKRKISLREKLALDHAMEEYNKLDYEGTIGDLKTRFKYTTVAPRKHGLRTDAILQMDDKELNQYVPLKALAPYRESEWKVPKNKKYALKLKIKSGGKGEDLNDGKKHMKHKQRGDVKSTVETVSLEQGETKPDESNREVVAISRRKKRRDRQAELKISQNRRQAYGLLPNH